MNIFSLNATLVAELVVFAVVVVVVVKVVLPPLRQAMNDRQAAIRKGLADTEAAEIRLDEAEAEYERRVAAAHQQARKILDTYQAMGVTIEAEARQRAEEHRQRHLTARR